MKLEEYIKNILNSAVDTEFINIEVKLDEKGMVRDYGAHTVKFNLKLLERS